MSVDLPEPDEPMIATNSPGCDREIDAAKGLHLHVADLESPPDVSRAVMSGRGMCCFRLATDRCSGRRRRGCVQGRSSPAHRR